ncbi:hypothetical protein [Bradyrhizobium sp. USDA 4452]
MKDMVASLEKLRRDAAEAALVRDLATNKAKRALYTRLAEHFANLADQVEIALAADSAGIGE